MRVLVTGGAGFIGSFVARELLSRGDEVAIIDDFNDYYDPALKRARLSKVLAGAQRPALFEVDIRDEQALAKAFESARPEKVVHLAAWAAVRPSIMNPVLYTQVNVIGTVKIFEACVKHDVQSVVFASSSSVYGRSAPLPFREDIPCDMPIAPYAASKRAGELYAWMYNYLYNLPIICLRFFTVYGPWGRPDMATWKFADKIYRGEPITLHRYAADGSEVKRDFTYVDDIVQGTLAALGHDKGFDIVNLGGHDPVPLTRFVKAIEGGLGKKAKVVERKLPQEEVIVTSADISHAQEKLGFEPTVSIEEGERRFAKWYRDEYLQLFPEGLVPSQYWSS